LAAVFKLMPRSSLMKRFNTDWLMPVAWACPFREQQFRIRHEDSEAESEAWLVRCFD
jgi:hypothetical protein